MTTDLLTSEAFTTAAVVHPTTESATTESPTTRGATTESLTVEVFSTESHTTTFVTEVTTAAICTGPEDSCEGHYTCDEITGAKICNDGFQGRDCKDRDFDGVIDPLCPDVGNVCKNGGTCFNQTCCCLDGFVGEICETEINECDSDPCLNDGVCIDEVDKYTCICQEGTISLQHNEWHKLFSPTPVLLLI